MYFNKKSSCQIISFSIPVAENVLFYLFMTQKLIKFLHYHQKVHT